MSTNYPNAKYTITFLEFVSEYSAWFSASIVMSSSARTTNIQNALKNKWNFYEISGETIGEMKQMILDTFNYWKQYYEDMLNAYDREFDYTTGITRTVRDAGSEQGIHVELPNKQISATDIYAYPDDANKVEHDNTVTTTDNTRYLEMRQKYMRQIRNLYNEFADKFYDCFIHVFGGSL